MREDVLETGGKFRLNNRNPRYALGLRVFLVIALIQVGAVFSSAGAAQFTPPDIEGFDRVAEYDRDGDGDGIRETHITRYRNSDGDSLVSLTTRGRLWAWSLNSNENNLPTKNYVIRDGDCDGIYDEVYSLDDEFFLPECLE